MSSHPYRCFIGKPNPDRPFRGAPTKKNQRPLPETEAFSPPLLVIRYPTTLKKVIMMYVASVFVACNQRRGAAAKTLGISDTTLNRWIRRIEAQGK